MESDKQENPNYKIALLRFPFFYTVFGIKILDCSVKTCLDFGETGPQTQIQ